MSAELEVFTYTGQQVRTVLVDGDPWFVAADVARILGYAAAKDMTRSLDDDEKGGRLVPTPGGPQELTVISEPGLYKALVQRQTGRMTDAESARRVKAFQRWITHDLLPTVRKTGSYRGQIASMPLSEQLAIAAEAARRAEELEAQAAIDAPKVESFEAFMDADGAYTMDAAAKSLSDVSGGMGRNNLFAFLRDRKVLMGGNRPYQRYAHLFKVVAGSYEDRNGVSHTTYTTYVRPAGLDAMRRWLVDGATR